MQPTLIQFTYQFCRANTVRTFNQINYIRDGEGEMMK